MSLPVIDVKTGTAHANLAHVCFLPIPSSKYTTVSMPLEWTMLQGYKEFVSKTNLIDLFGLLVASSHHSKMDSMKVQWHLLLAKGSRQP